MILRCFTLSLEGHPCRVTKSHALRLLPSYPRNPSNPRLPLDRSIPLFSYSSALFAHNGAPQLLSYQSLPHSFPCNGGWGVSFLSQLSNLPTCNVQTFLSTLVPRIGRSPVRGLFPFWGLLATRLPRTVKGALRGHLRSLHPASTTGTSLATAFTFFAPCYLLRFHANTNCPVCNSFVLITMQQCRGWGGSDKVGE